MYCRKCGTYNQDENNFCVNCNEPLKKLGNNETINQSNGERPVEERKPVSIEKKANSQDSNTNGYQPSNGYQNANGYQSSNGYQNTNGYQNQNTYQNQNSYQNSYGYQNSNAYSSQNQYNYQNQGPYTVKTTSDIPEEFTPISAWGYIGYMFLFAIPLVGLVLLFVFSFGGSRNYNLRNFARSYLIMMMIGIILVIILFITAGAFIGSFYNEILSEMYI